MSKIKIAFSAIHYPLTMARFFWEELERRDDVELWSFGPFTDDWIPWGGGMTIDKRYVKVPDLPLPRQMIQQWTHPALIENALPWKPDLWLHVDAGWRPNKKLECGIAARIQTDPHVLKDGYNHSAYFDYEFCMQDYYRRPGDLFLPYGLDPHIHYPMDLEKETDVCMIGLQYDHRASLASLLTGKGYSVDFRLGVVYDEYREAYNKSKIALSWSSLKDLPSRVWEGMGMNIPVVTNRLPDLDLFFEEGEHYLGFSTINEAIEKIEWALQNYEEAQAISEKAYQLVSQEHTYEKRVQTLLEEVGLC